MEVRIEIRKIANDSSRCAYLVSVRASVGIAGTLFPYLAISVRDENEAIAIADENSRAGSAGVHFRDGHPGEIVIAG